MPKTKSKYRIKLEIYFRLDYMGTLRILNSKNIDKKNLYYSNSIECLNKWRFSI